MHAISHGNISAVRFDTLVAIVSGDVALTVGVHELQDLLKVVQELLASSRSAAPRQSAKTSAIFAAIAGGTLKDLDDLGSAPLSAPAPAAEEPADPTPVAPAVVAKAEPVEAPKPAPIPALQRRARGSRDIPSASSLTGPSAPTKAAPIAPVVTPAPVAPPAPVAAPKVDAAPPPAPSAPAAKRAPTEILLEAIVAFLEPRTRPQSVDRIARAVRKVDGAPQVTEIQLRELLKILVKKGSLVRSPAGGFSIAGAE